VLRGNCSWVLLLRLADSSARPRRFQRCLPGDRRDDALETIAITRCLLIEAHEEQIALCDETSRQGAVASASAPPRAPGDVPPVPLARSAIDRGAQMRPTLSPFGRTRVRSGRDRSGRSRRRAANPLKVRSKAGGGGGTPW